MEAQQTDILLEAVHTTSDGRNFVEVAFLASHVARAEQDNPNAVADAVDEKLRAAMS